LELWFDHNTPTDPSGNMVMSEISSVEMPEPIVNRLNRALAEVMVTPETEAARIGADAMDNFNHHLGKLAERPMRSRHGVGRQGGLALPTQRAIQRVASFGHHAQPLRPSPPRAGAGQMQPGTLHSVGEILPDGHGPIVVRLGCTHAVLPVALCRIKHG
jgi:hypothetical protein